MKRFLGYICMIDALCAACSGAVVDEDKYTDTLVPVGFTAKAETRAAVTGTTLPDGSLFKVWGGYKGNNVFTGREVTKTASGCTYTGTEYWVAGQTYNFYAVYPAELPEGATPTVEDNGTVSISNFDCSATGDAAVDLMTASTPNVDANGMITNQSSVGLNFNHLLSYISFSFENNLTEYPVEVTGISFNICTKGDYSSTSNTSWTNIGNGTITLYPEETPLKVPNNGNVTSRPSLIIPQTNTGVNVTFTITIREIDETTGSSMTVVKRFTSPLGTTNGEWIKGQSYNYKATLTDELMEMDDLTEITLNVTIKDWEKEDASVSWGGNTTTP